MGPAPGPTAATPQTTMLLDRITLERFSTELHAAWEGRRLHRVTADGAGMSLEAQGAPAHSLQVAFGPPGRIGLGPSRVREERPDRSLRYLMGARVESVTCQQGDRVVLVRLSRSDASGEPTYGVLMVMVIPPRYRLCLVGERHGRILGAWSGEGDRRAPRIGDLPRFQGLADRADPASLGRAEWEALLSGPGTLEEALRRSVAGMDRHVIARLCADAGAEPGRALADCGRDVAEGLGEAGRRLHHGPHHHVFRWTAGGGWVRVSVLEPVNREVERFASVSEALRSPVSEPDEFRPGAGQQARLKRALDLLERRTAALQSDLEEARRVDHLERAAHSLMASGDTAVRGPGRLEVADVHDPAAEATIVVELEPGRSAAGQAGRMLKRARRYRRRLEVLPPRLQRLQEQQQETRELLERLQGEGIKPLPEEEMELLESRLGLNRTSQGRRGSPGQEPSAHPRRYRTSTGWSVWSGRNNRENDLLTHRLAAQNDLWLHARGYSGSHVILRREGRKEEPSRTTLEEAAAVAAYWSKGRTANRVPVVYTLAKYVFKPRGSPPGLASVKREKTLMVQPSLLPAEEGP